jgi:hypothetical protein
VIYPFPAGNVVWSPTDITALLCQPGYMSPDDWRPVTACAVVLAESGGNPLAVGKPIWRPGTIAHRAVAIGMFQLLTSVNVDADPYPDVPRITVAACFDPFAAWQHTWRLLNKQRTGWGYNWSGWEAFTTGGYRRHVQVALAGMRTYRAGMGFGEGGF